ncbi:cytochrome d ubiquinol oxidase subunit II [Pseudomonas citronellolis]|jgi:cytochrome d ubiquinol oxidase subunit II|uniref:cytochrome d ubiquinol oxidase subunit II n=1 Tax=Pseudomonas TaxID=286 RepID=UPI0020A0DAEA|nr:MULTISPECIES: cytochrome d ubiquinol oxidase subunit II [Pseudomonas]MCP1645729.1 cytochrome d ubiquinol oxidase subunit II [Pseudomonas citronellolis]MCP1668393.1 cytochrome d ubiquinol oxidase subunit II [Pseudomonas citronellolis]MCP1700001.1 cytochrome d ubiquinol oxidase subunit II [Pseudomonas citronellolis]MCP1706370.1 cytochrome d ubiquinol oxidase subunit II [Pseudomonas citronellolis]MCP1800160.1 cytochrome d ubiquinol oxidase subunit II [Pseudomonas citronellolis]
MGIQGIDLSVIWGVIIAFGLMMYVIMDGFDLGLGILFPLVSDSSERDVMMNTVAPVWDGNETWAVLGAAALYGAFPLAYSVILEALYLPLVLVLAGLIFRGVAFEFRFKAKPQKRHIWDKAFIAGSFLATFFQGVAIGTYINGIPVVDRQFAGGPLDWLSPFPLFCGLGLVVAYALLGSTWLLVKTEGMLESRMRHYSRPLTYLLAAVIVVICAWTAWLHPNIAQLWFSGRHWVLFAVIAALAVASMCLVQSNLRKRHSHLPFISVLALMFLGYLALAVSIWPKIIPPAIDLWQAASPPSSQLFALIGALFIIPIILMYTFWSYHVFRGKVTAADAYH